MKLLISWLKSPILLHVLIILILIFIGFKIIISFNISIPTDLENKKIFIEIIATIIQTIILIIASFVAYYKFLIIKELNPKLIINFTSTIIKTTQGMRHAIDVEFQNVGKTPIWVEEIKRKAIFDNDSKIIELHDFDIEPQDIPKNSQLIIDVGENIYEHLNNIVPNNITCVTYKVILKSKNNTWSRVFTVKNEETKDK